MWSPFWWTKVAKMFLIWESVAEFSCGEECSTEQMSAGVAAELAAGVLGEGWSSVELAAPVDDWFGGIRMLTLWGKVGFTLSFLFGRLCVHS